MIIIFTYPLSFIFLCSLCIHFITSTSLFKIPFELIVNHFSIGITDLSNPTITCYYSIDMETPYSNINPGKSQCQTISFQTYINNQYLRSQQCKSQIQFPNKIQFNFTYYYPQPETPKQSLYVINKIGFGYEKEISKHSLYNQLYEQGIIQYRSFIFIYNKNNLGDIYFEGVPSEYTQYKSKFKCEIINASYKWGCLLHKITITSVTANNVVFHIDDLISFQADERFMLVPESFMNELNKLFFTEYIQQEKCVSFKVFNQYTSIQCKEDVVHLFPNISLYIGEFAMRLTYKEVFDEKYGVGNFKLYTCKGNEKWMFGGYFLMKYVTYFDYERKEISVYTNDIVFEYLQRNRMLSVRCGLVVIIICGFGLLHIMLFKKINNFI